MMAQPPFQRFPYLNLNMRYTTQAWNAKPTDLWLRIAHLVATMTLISFLLIAACEAMVKNGSFLLINSGICLANKTYPCLYPLKTNGATPS